MDCSYKENWEQTAERFTAWWKREGLILDMGPVSRTAGPREPLEDPGPRDSAEQRWTDVAWRIEKNHYDLFRTSFPADTLLRTDVNLGAGSLALLLGSEPGFEEDTVWIYPSQGAETDPDKRGSFKFDPENPWWKIHESLLRLSVSRGAGKYCLGVSRKVAEINAVWFEVYDRIYEIIEDEDGSACYQSFNLWGPGKTAKVQCDASAMFSPAMFEQFVLPALTEQCDWLDYSMFHLDGHQCIPHLDLLLSIDSLDAVEWTPDPQVPGGGNPRWYDMYRRILGAGKSVQAIYVHPEEVVPLLDAVGGKGMYIRTNVRTEAKAEALARSVEPFR